MGGSRAASPAMAGTGAAWSQRAGSTAWWMCFLLVAVIARTAWASDCAESSECLRSAPIGVAFHHAERRRQSGRDYFAAQYPACMFPVKASMAASRLATHDSGSERFAKPFLYDSSIHYSTPDYPGALRSLLALSP